jgi:hypothetical protein
VQEKVALGVAGDGYWVSSYQGNVNIEVDFRTKKDAMRTDTAQRPGRAILALQVRRGASGASRLFVSLGYRVAIRPHHDMLSAGYYEHTARVDSYTYQHNALSLIVRSSTRMVHSPLKPSCSLPGIFYWIQPCLRLMTGKIHE